MSDTARVRVTEIFHTLQGEGLSTGERTVFIRLTGCPLRCVYCDTDYAFKGGEWMSLDDVVESVARYGVSHVCVTGGEPLAQRDCPALLVALCDAGYAVSLETAGALDVCGVDPRVVKVMDVKTPASGEHERNRWGNLKCLAGRDQIKFVICDKADYHWATARVAELHLDRVCTVLFSPAADRLAPRDLAEWILSDRLPVRFQLQLHKILWGNERGR